MGDRWRRLGYEILFKIIFTWNHGFTSSGVALYRRGSSSHSVIRLRGASGKRLCCRQPLPPTRVATTLTIDHACGLWVHFMITRHETPHCSVLINLQTCSFVLKMVHDVDCTSRHLNASCQNSCSQHVVSRVCYVESEMTPLQSAARNEWPPFCSISRLFSLLNKLDIRAFLFFFSRKQCNCTRLKMIALSTSVPPKMMEAWKL